MQVKRERVSVRDLIKGYEDNQESGVVGYGGRLDIRPAYQREFIYGEKERNAVIKTVKSGHPLSVMYWADCGKDKFEIIDGQQRTISICQYVHGDFSYEKLYFHNLQDKEQNEILDYELMIFSCSGDSGEKLDWFEVVNIAGKPLNKQELRNAVYHGSWVSDARRYFSKTGCAAYGLASGYVTGVPIRQDYLETAIKWISNNAIEDYMGRNMHKKEADELWLYFRDVIDWTQKVFTTYREEMKGVEWGFLFNEYKDKSFEPKKIEKRVAELMEDDDILNLKGIYPYILTGDERTLNLRRFDKKQKRQAYERQKGVCVKCQKEFKMKDMEADHIEPWSKGGKTILENCQMLCKPCNARKSDK